MSSSGENGDFPLNLDGWSLEPPEDDLSESDLLALLAILDGNLPDQDQVDSLMAAGGEDLNLDLGAATVPVSHKLLRILHALGEPEPTNIIEFRRRPES